MKFKDTLNTKLWDLKTNDLIPEVKEKLEEIADAFIEFLEIPEDSILDKVITGSSASYNYNEHSDLDLHIVVDYDKVHEDCPLVNGYLNSLKKQFNDNHDITIHDVPVELYAEQKDQGTVHNGLYSLNTGWIDQPKKIPPTDNDAAVEAKYQEIKDMVDKCDDSEEADQLLEKIYNMRKAGLAEAGEFCTENLAFKKLRNEGYMDKLRKLKKEKIDKELSLESYNEEVNPEYKDMWTVFIGWMQHKQTGKLMNTETVFLTTDEYEIDDWYNDMKGPESFDYVPNYVEYEVPKDLYLKVSKSVDLLHNGYEGAIKLLKLLNEPIPFKQLSLESYNITTSTDKLNSLHNCHENWEDDEYDDGQGEMVRTKYVAEFDVDGVRKNLYFWLYTDNYNDSYYEVTTMRDDQIGLYPTYQKAKDKMEQVAKEVAQRKNITYLSLEELGQDNTYFLKRNGYSENFMESNESIQDKCKKAINLLVEGQRQLGIDTSFTDEYEKRFNEIKPIKSHKIKLNKAKKLLFDLIGYLVDEKFDKYCHKVEKFLDEKNESLGFKKLNKKINNILNEEKYVKLSDTEIKQLFEDLDKLETTYSDTQDTNYEQNLFDHNGYSNDNVCWNSKTNKFEIGGNFSHDYIPPKLTVTKEQFLDKKQFTQILYKFFKRRFSGLENIEISFQRLENMFLNPDKLKVKGLQDGHVGYLSVYGNLSEPMLTIANSFRSDVFSIKRLKKIKDEECYEVDANGIKYIVLQNGKPIKVSKQYIQNKLIKNESLDIGGLNIKISKVLNEGIDIVYNKFFNSKMTTEKFRKLCKKYSDIVNYPKGTRLLADELEKLPIGTKLSYNIGDINKVYIKNEFEWKSNTDYDRHLDYDVASDFINHRINDVYICDIVTVEEPKLDKNARAGEYMKKLNNKNESLDMERLNMKINRILDEGFKRLTKTEQEIEKILRQNGFKTSEVEKDPGKTVKLWYVKKDVKLDGFQHEIGTKVEGKDFKEILKKVKMKFGKYIKESTEKSLNMPESKDISFESGRYRGYVSKETGDIVYSYLSPNYKRVLYADLKANINDKEDYNNKEILKIAKDALKQQNESLNIEEVNMKLNDMSVGMDESLNTKVLTRYRKLNEAILEMLEE